MDEAVGSKAPELVALFGRRRVGKTFLVRNYLKKNLAFELVGIRDAKLSEQLDNFHKALGLAAGNDNIYRVPGNWQEAFGLLNHYLAPTMKKGKCVIFFDEFPWLNSPKSNFLQAFDHWWNSWGTKQDKLVVIICGSAASWMIQNIVNNKGGLHNRITRKIRLLPFNLHETEQFLQEQQVVLDRYQVLQLYMAFGGIPHYLKEVRRGESATQVIDRVCFTKDGLLTGEFKNLYHSLFDEPTRHLAVVRVLAGNTSGLTRAGIIEEAGLSSGGTTSLLLEELIESGFITAWQPYDKRIKDFVYKLSDEFTHFYLKFMEHARSSGPGSWERLSTSQSYKSWNGVAFERVCLKHISQLKRSLGIANIQAEESTWRYLPKKGDGAQIDLLIDRADLVINICEMKFSTSTFTIDKSYAAVLENKREIFRQHAVTRKSLFLTMVTTFGVKNNEYYARLIQNSVTMDVLFEQ